MRRAVLKFIFILFQVNSSVMAQNFLPSLPMSNKDGFIVIAHRGASYYAPENTHSAFKLAVEMKAEMIELDLLLSKDGVPVIIHDEELFRTTGVNGKVSEYTVTELKNLNTGSWFSDDYDAEPFPTLEEVLSYTKGKIALNIEIKHESVTDTAEGGVVDKALMLVRKAGMEEQVIFSSFDYRVMQHLNKLAPNIPKAILYEPTQSGELTPSQLTKKYAAHAFNCNYKQLRKEWIEDLNKNNIPFFVYTVNDEETMKIMISKGVAGIFSDKPDVLNQVVENL